MTVPTSISASDVIYLDNNATTPLAPEVLHAINSSAANAFANPSSSSLIGRAAKKLIIQSRAEIAQMINADPFDIIFTSGGTESNNWIVYSVLKYYYNEIGNVNDVSVDDAAVDKKLPHIVTTQVEHDAMLEPIKRLIDEQKVTASFVPVEAETGSIKVEKVLACLRNETILVSIMLANNETGAIFPVSEIMSKAKEWVKKERPNGPPLFCHSDAAQAIGKMSVDVVQLNVDYLTIVGHKFYGPRIGALYVKSPGQKTPLAPMFFGGGQERGFRSGTENTPMIVGLGAAARLVNLNLHNYVIHMSGMKKYLLKKLKESFPAECLHFNHPNVQDDSLCLVNTVNVGFFKSDWILFTGSAVLNNMNRVVASTGAACHSVYQGSGVTKPSRVLTDVGIQNDVAIRSLRISVGRQTTKTEIDEAVIQLYNAVCLGAQTKI